MRLFLNKQPGSMTFGLFPVFGFAFDWKDAEDERTWIWPSFWRIKYNDQVAVGYLQVTDKQSYIKWINRVLRTWEGK